MNVTLEQASWRCCYASQIAECGWMTSWETSVDACGWVCANRPISLSHLGGAECFPSQVSKTVPVSVLLREEDEWSLVWERGEGAGGIFQPNCRHLTQYFQKLFFSGAEAVFNFTALSLSTNQGRNGTYIPKHDKLSCWQRILHTFYHFYCFYLGWGVTLEFYNLYPVQPILLGLCNLVSDSELSFSVFRIDQNHFYYYLYNASRLLQFTLAGCHFIHPNLALMTLVVMEIVVVTDPSRCCNSGRLLRSRFVTVP